MTARLVNLVALLLGLLLGGVSVSAFAENYSVIIKWKPSQSLSEKYSTGQAACVREMKLRAGVEDGVGTASSTTDGAGPTAYICSTPSSSSIGNAVRDLSCPGGGFLDTVGGVIVCKNATACVAPLVRDPATGVCVEPSPCGAMLGVTTSGTFFAGWLNPTTGAVITSEEPPPSTASFSACAATRVPGAGPTACYTYSTNASKSYCDWAYTYNGDDSVGTDTPSNSPTGACQSGQTYGTVNGVSGCYSSANPNDPANTNPVPVKPGAPPASGDPVAPVDPAAPPEDGTGSGSGANGGGTSNSGGGSGPGGTGGGGTGGTGSGDMTCPGCAQDTTLQSVDTKLGKGIGENGVIVDEKASDWSDDRDGASTKNDDMVQAFDAQKTRYDQASSSGAGSLGISGLTQWTAPTQAEASGLDGVVSNGGGCSPFAVSLYGSSMALNYCSVSDYLRPLINWAAAAFTMLYIWARLYRKPGAV